MIVNGVYTSVWNNAICLTADVEVNISTHTFQLPEMPRGIPGLDFCTKEFVTLPFSEALQAIDPSGKTQKDFPACHKDALASNAHTETYLTYNIMGESI